MVLDKAKGTKKLASGLDERVPIAEGSKILQQIKDALNLTAKEMAKEIGIPHKTMQDFLKQTPTAKTIPNEIILKAQKLKDTRVSKHGKEHIRQALEAAGGVKINAAKALKIDFSRLNKLIDDYDLGALVKQKDLANRFTLEQIQTALRNSRTQGEAAKILGISRAGLVKYLRRNNIEKPD